MRTVAIINGNTIANIVIIGRETQGDLWFDTFDGTTVIADPNDTYGELFITLENCAAVEITELDPQPKIGWVYENDTFVAKIT